MTSIRTIAPRAGSLRPAACVLAWLAVASAPAAMAQSGGIQSNVRVDYGQVLRAEPVYQTQRETWLEQQCSDGRKQLLSRIVGAVKDVLKPGESRGDANCREVPVEREFRRAVGYDVDYIYKGGKYRSRLPHDPGNRIKLRVSVTPYGAIDP